ncbi:MAG: hypothetical protein QOD06_1369 [Candidatus Binatota bacterium]|jgi:DNA-binding NarL/FixJ family response regulator|nr:hypothetical protein [Candidatus Binatota bacterium]
MVALTGGIARGAVSSVCYDRPCRPVAANPPFMESSPPVRILLVDDSPTFAGIARRYLSSHAGIEVVGVAETAADALDRCHALRPDLVLTDVELPDGNGLDLIRTLKEAHNAPRIVVMTVHPEDGYAEVARAARADGFVSKSDLTGHLLPLLRSLFPQLSRSPASDER